MTPQRDTLGIDPRTGMAADPKEGERLVDAWLGAVDFGQIPIVRVAARLAEYAHRDQRRKYTFEPYIMHPMEVATMVAPFASYEMIAAALLHDTIEDTDLPHELIADATSELVLQYVMELSDVSTPEDGNRAARKAKDREHTAGISGHAQTIKLADLISNTQSIVARDPKFAAVYMVEKRELLPVLRRGSRPLFDKAQGLVDDYFKAVATTGGVA
jgi:(p)ppGpp synthase/HD superfamily hydrolase